MAYLFVRPASWLSERRVKGGRRGGWVGSGGLRCCCFLLLIGVCVCVCVGHAVWISVPLANRRWLDLVFLWDPVVSCAGFGARGARLFVSLLFFDLLAFPFPRTFACISPFITLSYLYKYMYVCMYLYFLFSTT